MRIFQGHFGAPQSARAVPETCRAPLAIRRIGVDDRRCGLPQRGGPMRKFVPYACRTPQEPRKGLSSRSEEPLWARKPLRDRYDSAL